MLKIILAVMGRLLQYPSEIDRLDDWIAKKKPKKQKPEIQERFCAAYVQI